MVPFGTSLFNSRHAKVDAHSVYFDEMCGIRRKLLTRSASLVKGVIILRNIRIELNKKVYLLFFNIIV